MRWPGPVFVLLVVCAVSFAPGLGSTPLWDPDEPRFASATREMMATGDRMSPRYNGEPRFEKPILFYWLQLPFFAVLGPTETAARLPSLFAAVGCVLLAYAIGRSVFGARAALLGGLALATVLRFVAYARQGLTDVPVMFFEMAALYGFLQAARGGPRATWHAMAGWIAIGLGALTKGPVVIIPVVVWALYLVATRDRPALARWRVVPGALVAAAIALPWYALMAAVHGRAFLDLALGYEVVRRVIDFPSPQRGVWYYARILPADGLPWTIFAVLGCAHAAWRWRTLDETVRHGLILCAIWFAVVLALFSMASGKLPHYLLPLYAPLALMAGFYVDAVARGAAALRVWRAAAALMGVMLVVVAVVVARFLTRVTGAGPLDAGMLLPVILAAGGLAVLALGTFRARPVAGTVALVATLAMTYAWLSAFTLPHQLSGLYPTAQLGRVLATIVTPDDRVGVYGVVASPTLVFYSNHRVEPWPSRADLLRFLEGEGRAFAVVPEREVAALLEEAHGPLYEVARRPKLVVRFNRLFGRKTASLYDSGLVLLTNQPVSAASRRGGT